MSRKLTETMVDTAFAAGDAAVDSAVTITARLPILANCLLSPTADGIGEWHEACTEKLLALSEGAQAAWAGWTDLMWRSVFSPITPAGMAHEAMVLVRAVSEPGHSRVRANALRLGRR